MYEHARPCLPVRVDCSLWMEGGLYLRADMETAIGTTFFFSRIALKVTKCFFNQSERNKVNPRRLDILKPTRERLRGSLGDYNQEEKMSGMSRMHL